MIISIFLPHGGCPERCTFCDQSVSGGEPASKSKVRSVIEEHLASQARVDPQADLMRNEIAFYGGTFTAMPRTRQIEYLEIARAYVQAGRVGGIRVSTRPDAIERDWILSLRDTYNVRIVELGVQSFHEASLRALGRSHTIEDVVRAVELLHKCGLVVSLHLMLGNPNERSDEDAHTLEWIKRLNPRYVRIHPLLVLKGTKLEEQWRKGEYQPLDLDGAVTRAAWLAAHIEAAKLSRPMRVIRLGLQPNELLAEAVAAGPFHPGFGGLVREFMRNPDTPFCNFKGVYTSYIS